MGVVEGSMNNEPGWIVWIELMCQLNCGSFIRYNSLSYPLILPRVHEDLRVDSIQRFWWTIHASTQRTKG